MDIEDQLIQEVRQHRCLYDLSDKQYKNIFHKDQVWEQIGKRLHLDGDACRKRWKCLRDCYRRSKRARILSTRDGGPMPRKKWRHSEIMTFLDNVQSSRSNLSSFCEREAKNSPANSSTEYVELPNMTEDDYWQEDYQNKSPELSDISPDEATKQKIDPADESSKVEESFQNVAQTALNNIEDITRRFYMKKEQTSTEMIFAGLAKKIAEAKLPPRVIHSIEERVAQIVFEEIRMNLT